MCQHSALAEAPHSHFSSVMMDSYSKSTHKPIIESADELSAGVKNEKHESERMRLDEAKCELSLSLPFLAALK